MKETELSLSQAGALGGKKRWRGISKKERADLMSKVARARWHKEEQES